MVCKFKYLRVTVRTESVTLQPRILLLWFISRKNVKQIYKNMYSKEFTAPPWPHPHWKIQKLPLNVCQQRLGKVIFNISLLMNLIVDNMYLIARSIIKVYLKGQKVKNSLCSIMLFFNIKICVCVVIWIKNTA